MSGPSPAQAGYVHQAAIYESEQELLGVVVPQVQAAVAAREPVLLALSDHEAGAVRSVVGDPPGLTFLGGLNPQERPPTVLKRLMSLLGAYRAEGFQHIRVLHSIPHPGLGAPWDGWCRYEAALNDLLADFPVSGVCLYDRRITPTTVLDDVERTHPRMATTNGSDRPNHRYEDPIVFLQSRPPAPADPLETQPPALELAHPVPATSRQAVRDLARDTRLVDDDIDHLVLATSEAVTNALVHGRPPVVMRVWTAADRMVVTVSDAGKGPSDPYAGLLVRPSALHGGGGFGLWIVHQLVTATFSRAENQFTLRLIAGVALP